MKRMLDGAEIAGYIEERQARDVRALRQAWQVQPRLAVVVVGGNQAPADFVQQQENYGAEILLDVVVHRVGLNEAADIIARLNEDPSVHGTTLQAPLAQPDEAADLARLISAEKDVAAGGGGSGFDAPIPTAVLWLLAGYNIELQQGKKTVIVGDDAAATQPLQHILAGSGADVTIVAGSTSDAPIIKEADIVLVAFAQPGIITAAMLKNGAVVVDVAPAYQLRSESVNILAEDVYQRPDISATTPHSLTPLVVAALFENVIRAARPAA